jgi:oligosaccharide repeat unit polymerase
MQTRPPAEETEIMEAISLIVFFALLVVLMAMFTKDYGHPSVLMPGLWALAGIANLILSPEVMSQSVAIFYGVGIATFSLGGLLGSHSRTGRHFDQFKADSFQPVNTVLLKVFSIGLICILPFFLYLYRDYLRENFTESLSSTRQEAIKGESLLRQGNFFVRKVPTLSFVLAVLQFHYISIAKQPKPSERVFAYVMIVIALTAALAEGARSGAISLLLFLFFLNGAIKGFNFKKTIYVALGVIAIFGAIMIAIHLEDSGLAGSLDVLTDVTSVMAYYYLQGYIAFDTVFQNLTAFQVPYFITLSGLNELLYRIGLTSHFDDLLVEGLRADRYIEIFFAGEYRRGNVYTFFYPYVHDYGATMSTVVMFGIGLFSGLAYSARRHFFGVLLYAYAMHGLVLSPFSDYYFAMLLSLGYLILFATMLRYSRIGLTFAEVRGDESKTKTGDLQQVEA